MRKKLRESFHSLVVRSLNDLLAGNNVTPNSELLSNKHDTKLTSRRLLFPDVPSINVCERLFRLLSATLRPTYQSSHLLLTPVPGVRRSPWWLQGSLQLTNSGISLASSPRLRTQLLIPRHSSFFWTLSIAYHKIKAPLFVKRVWLRPQLQTYLFDSVNESTCLEVVQQIE